MTRLRILCALLVLTAGLPTQAAAEGNEAPLADAGLDQTVTEGSVVFLDGGGAVDPDGEIVEYEWTIETPRGETIQPTNPDAELTRFAADSTGRYHVTLTVEDDDGDRRSDTLFVDVRAAAPAADGSSPPAVDDGSSPETGGGAASPSTGAGSTPDSPPQLDLGGSDSTVGTGSEDGPLVNGPATNQAPFGQIYGPDSIRAGSVGRYTLEATDSDGHVVDYWWAPPGALSMQGRELNTHTIGNSYTFDVDPGTTVRLPVVLVDNSGARSTISKTVQVTNNQPEATLVGTEAVVVGSIHEYEAIASDPDGPIASYEWDLGPGLSRVQTGGLLDGGGVMNQRSALVKFNEIPKDDATTEVAITVADEHGGRKTVKKKVAVLSQKRFERYNDENKEEPVLNSLQGKTIPGSNPVFTDSGVTTHHEFSFSASATDPDSGRLIYDWKFGDKGTARTVETGNSTSSNVRFIFSEDNELEIDIPITVIVEDQSGNTDSVTKLMTLKPTQASKTVGPNVQIRTNEGGLIEGYVTVPGSRPDYKTSRISISFGDGKTKMIGGGQSEGTQIGFSHRYEFGGTYSIYVFDGASQGGTYGRTEVTVNKRTYTEWEFERKTTVRSETVAKEQPGEDWKRAGVDHVEKRLVNTLNESTPILDGATLKPGPKWERIGTETEYNTEYRTRRSMESPGPNWYVSERSVDFQSVIDEWKSTTVPRKGVVDSDWEYVGPVSRTVERTQHRESTTEPSGDGWHKLEATGDFEQDGFSYEWVSSTYFAGDDWDYVRSDRYVRYWETETHCEVYADLGGHSYCVRESTTRTPVYDYRYLYKAPKYDEVYEWERTVEQTVYDHEYRYPTYANEPVHEYTKEVQVAERRATWRKDVFESKKVYKWSKTSHEWRSETAFARPTGVDVRNVRRITKDCGDDWEPGEPAICHHEGQR